MAQASIQGTIDGQPALFYPATKAGFLDALEEGLYRRYSGDIREYLSKAKETITTTRSRIEMVEWYGNYAWRRIGTPGGAKLSLHGLRTLPDGGAT